MAALLALLLFLAPITDEEPLPKPVRTMKYRQHYVMQGKGGYVLFEYTVIRDMSEKRMEIVVLLRDPGHGDVRLQDVHSFEKQESYRRISDVKNRSFVQVSLGAFPSTGRTFSEVMKEMRAQPQLLEVPTILSFETNGGQWKEVDTKLATEEELRQLRHAIRPTIDPYLLEAIERMRGTFFRTTEGSGYFDLLATFIVYDSESDPSVTDPAKQTEAACDFDASFGYPCTTEQLNRIRDARKEGKNLTYY